MNNALEIPPHHEWDLFSHAQRPLIIAGPCSAESEEQLLSTAMQLHHQGINIFRAGIWKPRTRPNCFEGVGEKGLPWLQQVRQTTGMKIAIEVANVHHVESALKHQIDILWIGARSTANPFVVQEIAEALRGVTIPVLVKNPINPDIDLWIGAIERLYLCGIKKIGAIHRGFSAYHTTNYRNRPQWQIPIELKQRIKTIPLFCDPSHISGQSEFLLEISQKAMDLGFDGLMIESHINPSCALSDAKQQITPAQLHALLAQLIIRNLSPSISPDSCLLDELREKIDILDHSFLDILSQRMQLVEQIGHYKKRNNLTILQHDRWAQILIQVKEMAQRNNLPVELVEQVFKAIHQASIDRQTHIMNQ